MLQLHFHIRAAFTRPLLGQGKGLSDSVSLGRIDHFLSSKTVCPAYLWCQWFGLMRFGYKEAKMRTSNSTFACLLSSPSFVRWSANPDNCFVPPGFYHCQEPIRLGDSVPLLESACSCSRISTFCATRDSHGQVTSFFLSSVSLWDGHVGKTGSPSRRSPGWGIRLSEYRTLHCCELCHWAVRTWFSAVALAGALQGYQLID